MEPAAPRDTKPDLARSLRLGHVILLAISSVTPASSVVVILPVVLFALHWGAPIAFLVAVLVCVPLAYCYSSLGRQFPSAGGEYAFARRFFGSGVARATWTATMLGITLAIAAMIQGAARLLAGVLGPGTETWSAVAICAAVALIAPQHVRRGAWITSVMLFIEIVAVLGIVAVGIVGFLTSGSSVESCTSAARSSLASLEAGHVLAYVAVAYFALAGFGSAVILGEEDLDSGRLAARAVGWTLALTFALEFVPLMALLLGSWCGPVPPDDGSGLLTALPAFSSSPALESAVLTTAAIACANAAIAIAMLGARIVYSAARDDLLPGPGARTLSRLRERTRAPMAATILVVSAAGLAALLPAERVIAVASAALLIPPAIVAASRLAWKDGPAGPFRRWLPPAIALLALALVAGFGISEDPWAFAVPAAAGLVGLGYDRWSRRTARRR